MRKVIIFLVVTILWALLIATIVSYKLSNNSTDETVSKGISYRSAVVMDIDSNKVLYQYNAHTPLLTASIAKIVTCIVALEKINYHDYYLVNEKILTAVGSRIYLEVGDLVQIKDLLYGLMLESGNDAALAIALAYNNVEDFVSEMNALVTKMGLKNSVFENPSGLDENNKNMSSAYDMAMLSAYAFKNPYYQEIIKAKKYQCQLISGRTLYFNHKHKLVLHNENVLGGKTGYTEKAGRTLVTYFQTTNHRLVVVTMDAYNDWQTHISLAQMYD